MLNVRKILRIVPVESRLAVVRTIPLSFLGGLLDLSLVFSVTPFLLAASAPDAWSRKPCFQSLGLHTPQLLLAGLGTFSLISLGAREAFTLWFAWRQARLAACVQNQLSQALLKIYLYQDYRFFLSRHSSDLSQNVLVRVNRFMVGLFQPLLGLITSTASFVLFCGVLTWINPLLAGVILVLFGSAHWLVARRLRPRLADLAQRARDLNNLRFRTASEALQGIRQAKLSACESYYLQTYRSQNEELNSLQLRLLISSRWPGVISRLSLLTITVLGVLALVGTGQLSRLVPLTVVSILLVLRLVPRIQGLFEALLSLLSEQKALDDLVNDLWLPIVEGQANPLETTRLVAEIRLESVGLRYCEERAPALSDVCLVIPRGARVAIVGPTGAGKTTLLDVLTGLLAPECGDVLVDGVSIRNRAAGWRANIGYVSQENYLVDATLEQNIAFGVCPQAIDRERLERSLEAADLREFVESLPQGYQTWVGERGVALSQGQRQRIGIARALYRNPEIVVLDEATSHLDPLSEQRVLANLNNWSPALTLIMVTHRLQTAASSCQKLFVLSKGRLVAQGSESELRDSCSEFAEMISIGL